MMDSPPPSQVPRRDPLMDVHRSLHHRSPTPTDSANNSFTSPSHHNARDREGDLTNMSNGHSASSLSSHAYTVAAQMAMAQLHNQHLMAAQAQMRHSGVPNHLGQMMRKQGLMPHKAPGGPYRSPPPVPTPSGPPGSDHNACSLIKYREHQVAAFQVEGRELICLPQAFDLFLKDLVGGLHTVYTKLKRLDITPIVCNVEQVRILRGLGAIQPGVNRCKLISCSEFDVLYEDCTNSNARPGRPPKRNPIHASPETLEKLSKKNRMDGSDFNYDARFFVPGDGKVLNAFPPAAYPYHYYPMNVNTMMSPPVSAAMLAASHFMRSDPSVTKEGKAFMEQELLNRQNPLGFFGAPSLGDQHLPGRHPDADPNKPMNLSNGSARGSLDIQATPSTKMTSDDDDDDDDVINDDKISDDDNDADMDDNSNDISDSYIVGEVDKPAVTGVRQELPLVNGGLSAKNAAPSEVEKILLSVLELTQKAFNAVRQSQDQIGQDKENVEEELHREKELRMQIEKRLEDERKKGETLEKRWRKEKKFRRQLQMQVEGNKPVSPGSGGHIANNAISADMGLDLAMKTMPSPEEPTRTQNTDAADSETEAEKHRDSLSDSDRKLSGPMFIDARRREEVHSE
ncbi:dachshund homolog dac-1-like isoform X2 [Littorina saxatilis]|uniref:dachshund homolog dac-1-like isoform X2 n=1 Tax=Littorina saxatilis TaxID=31220 RepID=UPI0038B57014